MIPNNFNQITIYEDISEFDLKGCFLYNPIRGEGGYFSYGNDNGFSLSNGYRYIAGTGDSLHDQIIINGFKVYRLW